MNLLVILLFYLLVTIYHLKFASKILWTLHFFFFNLEDVKNTTTFIDISWVCGSYKNIHVV